MLMWKCRRRLPWYRMHTLIISVAMFMVITMILLNPIKVEIRSTLILQRMWAKKAGNRIRETRISACVVPKLDPFDREAMKYIKDVGSHECSRKSYGKLKNGFLEVKASGVRYAHFRYILRPDGNDFGVNLSHAVPVASEEPKQVKAKQGMIGCLISPSGVILGTKKGQNGEMKSPIEWVAETQCVFENFFRISETGRLQDFNEAKCLDFSETCASNCAVELTKDCNKKSSEFTFEQDGRIKHVQSGKCLQINKRPNEREAKLSLAVNCSGDTEWRFLDHPVKDFEIKKSVEQDYLELLLLLDKTVHKEYPISIKERQEVAERANKINKKPVLRYNVALLVVDSQSASNFQRKLPKTYKLLKDNTNTVMMKGHTIVGDGTTPQLNAILTGALEVNMPEARRGKAGAQHVDIWPFIFKNYTQRGYATFFMEDTPSLGCFNYRLHGFKNPPTDHYGRPFWLQTEQHEHSGFCLGDQYIFKINLDYTLSFYNAYKNIPKFSLTLFSNMFHGDLNNPQHADSGIANFIETMEKEGHLQETVLLVMGDHGTRTSQFRTTVVGKLEERLPFMSITLPPGLAEKHPEFRAALEHNSRGLTSQFDIHATLRHLLEFPHEHKVAIGQSLFTEIDESKRTCATAGIKDIWCPCLQFSAQKTNDTNVIEAAKAAVEFIINKIIKPVADAKDQCSVLELERVTRAGKRMPSKKIQQFKQTTMTSKCDDCGEVFEEKSNDEILDLEIVFQVKPSGGIFEATAAKRNSMWVVSKDIGRLNLYGKQPRCVEKKYPYLRKFCYCT